MPNWSNNHTVFIGPAQTLGAIHSAVHDGHGVTRSAVYSGEFDFNQLRPRPEVYDVYTAPTHIISDEEFAEKYGFDAPTSIDEFIEVYKLYNADIPDDHNKKQFNDVPETVFTLILDTYGYNNWYDWCVTNWGTKRTGSFARAWRHSPNLLTVDYKTAWSAPLELFDYLEDTYPDLQIINGSMMPGISDRIEVTNGSDTAFDIYYATSLKTSVQPYEVTVDGHNIRDIKICTQTFCEANEENIRTMIDAGYLINADGDSIEINTIP